MKSVIRVLTVGGQNKNVDVLQKQNTLKENFWFSRGQIDNKAVLVQFMAWRRVGGKNTWLMVTLFTDAYIYGLVQERRNSIANALELRLSCTNP